MPNYRVYQPGVYGVGETLSLDDGPAHHLLTVLRCQNGSSIELFDGENLVAEAELQIISKRKASALIRCVREENRESPVNIYLCQGLAKGEKMEWLVQKASELGVNGFYPIVSAHTAFKLSADKLAKKIDQWQNIAVGASEQCYRNRIMTVHNASLLPDFLKTVPDNSLCISLDPKAPTPLKALAKPETGWPVYLFIGPEGGFSEEERRLFEQHGFQSVSLGPRVLRTETAAISAVSILQALWGDL